MNKILFVNACFRPGSRTAKLANTVLQKLEGEVAEVKLILAFPHEGAAQGSMTIWRKYNHPVSQKKKFLFHET